MHELELAEEEGLESLKDREIQVPGDLGVVVLKDWMGDDAAVVQAARVSYGKGTKTVREDRGLIRYLMRNRHTSPFEQAEIKFLIRCPMDVWRQWIRHRTANVNEYSTRYSEAIDEVVSTPADGWRAQNAKNKQGSGDRLPAEDGERLSVLEARFHQEARALYRTRLDFGVAREQARKDLPLCTFTEAYWKIDLHNLLHFLELRTDPHAQLEIRRFADVIAGIVRRWVPLTWDAFLDYRVDAVTFSTGEQRVLGQLLMRGALGGLPGTEELSEREVEEFRRKVIHLRALAAEVRAG